MPSARDIAFIGCRLLALFVLYGVLLTSTHSVVYFLQALAASDENQSGMLQFAIANSVSLVANLPAFLALWFGSGWIADKVAAGTTDPKGEQSTVWSRHSALSLALVVLGVGFLIYSLPMFVIYLSLILQGQGGYSTYVPSLVSAVLASALGLICVLGPHGLANFIGKLRRW